MKRLALPLAALLSTACPGVLTKTDAAWVGDRLAERIYQEDRFERLCPHDADKFLPTAPAGCAAMAKALNEWKRANEVANNVQKVGTMPREEKKEIRKLVERVEGLP